MNKQAISNNIRFSFEFRLDIVRTNKHQNSYFSKLQNKYNKLYKKIVGQAKILYFKNRDKNNRYNNF